MRICLAASVHPQERIGGAELQTWMIAQNLATRGHEVHFWALRSEKRVTTVESTRDVWVTHFPRRMNILSKAIALYRRLKQGGIEVCYLRDIKFLLIMGIICQICKIPIIFNFYSFTDCLGRAYIKARVVYGSGLRGYLGYLRNKISLGLNIAGAKMADLVLALTHEQAKLLWSSHHIKSKVIPIGIPLEMFTNGAQAERTILWVGKDHKRPEIFVNLAQIFQDQTDLRFVLVCNLNRRAKKYRLLREKIQSLENLVYYDLLPLQEVNRLFKNAYIYVNTSQFEGFGNAILQAWTYATPVVSLNVDPDGIIKNHKLGFRSGSFEKLACDVKFLLENPKEQQEMGARARRYAMRHHDIQRVAQQYEEMFSEVVKIRQTR